MTKQTFFFIQPDQKSKRADMILDITRASYERATGLKWENVSDIDEESTIKWLEDIKLMDIINQTYVVLYILYYFYKLSDNSKFSKHMEKLLTDKEFKTARNIIWLCIGGEKGAYDVWGKIEPQKPFEFNSNLNIVDIANLDDDKIDEFIDNYK